MLRKMLFLVVTLLLCSGTIAFAAPPQPQMVGQHRIGDLSHIGTVTCVAEKIEAAIYGKKDELHALVLFKDNVGILAVVAPPDAHEEYFITQSSNIWSEVTRETVFATLVPTIQAYQECIQQMGM